MKRFIRILVVLLLLIAGGLMASSVGVVLPRSFHVAGPDGAPAAAWVAYIYQGSRLNFVDTTYWHQPGGIARADENGMIRLPMLVYLKVPTDGWLSHRIRLLHAPELHLSLRYPGPADGATVTLADNTGDPAAWEASLNEVHSLVAYDLISDTHERYLAEPEIVAELARLMVADYRSLLATHGDRPRTMPEDPPAHLQFDSEERRAEWRERMRRELEREPLWGDYLKHRFADRMAWIEDRFGQ